MLQRGPNRKTEGAQAREAPAAQASGETTATGVPRRRHGESEGEYLDRYRDWQDQQPPTKRLDESDVEFSARYRDWQNKAPTKGPGEEDLEFLARWHEWDDRQPAPTETGAEPTKSATRPTNDLAISALAEDVARKLQNPMGNPTMSVREVAHALTRSAATVYRYVDEGKLEFTGSKGRIRTSSVKTLLEKSPE